MWEVHRRQKKQCEKRPGGRQWPGGFQGCGLCSEYLSWYRWGTLSYGKDVLPQGLTLVRWWRRSRRKLHEAQLKDWDHHVGYGCQGPLGLAEMEYVWWTGAGHGCRVDWY